jgi:hypothetical protein
LQCLTGVLIYDEPFTHVQMVGFGPHLTALALYAADSLRRLQNRLESRKACTEPIAAARFTLLVGPAGQFVSMTTISWL